MLLARLNLGTSTHHHAAAACLVGLAHALHTIDERARGEVGSRDIVHQALHVDLRIVDVGDTAVDALAQVVGRDVRGHTHGNTRGTVHQQVREQRGQHAGLLLLAVEVIDHVHRLLLQVLHHSLAHRCQTCLGVTHGSGAVAIHGAEVTLTIDKRITHVPVLCQTYHGEIDTAVAVGVIVTEHITYGAGALTVVSVMGVAIHAHTIENTTVYGFEAVASIGQRTCHDDGHRVVEERAPHLALDVHFDNSVF